MTDLSVKFRIEDDAIITIREVVDFHTAPKLRKVAVNLLARECRYFVMDMNEVDFLDSAGIGILVGIYKEVQKVVRGETA